MENLKVLTVYISYSGGTRKIAHAIQRGVSKRALECRIVALKGNSGIPGMNPEDLLGYDVIGFGSPVWSHLPTPNMMSYIENLPPLNAKHVFAFLTHGTMPCGAMRSMVNALEEKQATVIGWNDWYSACFPVDIFKPYHTDRHPDEFDLAEATEFGRDLVKRSIKISEGKTDLIPKLPGKEEYERIYGPPVDLTDLEALIKSQPISVNMEKCIECGTCEENCPTGSINISSQPPLDKATCCSCFMCEQICPVGAIEVDFKAMMESMASMRGETSWQAMEFFQKSVERIDTDPRFRRLVPHWEVGKKGLWYELSKHPRFTIPSE